MPVHTGIQRLFHHFSGVIHQVFGFTHIDKSPGYDIRSRKDGIAVAFQSHDYDHDSGLRQMLTVAEYDESNTSHAQAVYENSTFPTPASDLRAVFFQFLYIT